MWIISSQDVNSRLQHIKDETCLGKQKQDTWIISYNLSKDNVMNSPFIRVEMHREHVPLKQTMEVKSKKKNLQHTNFLLFLKG